MSSTSQCPDVDIVAKVNKEIQRTTNRDPKKVREEYEEKGMKFLSLTTTRYSSLVRADNRILMRWEKDQSLDSASPQPSPQQRYRLAMNSVQDLYSEETFILGQAPLEDELPSFFEVVHDHTIGIIIALVTEREIARCDIPEYFRMRAGASNRYGQMKVTCSEIHHISKTSEVRVITVLDIRRNTKQLTFTVFYKDWRNENTLDPKHILRLYELQTELFASKLLPKKTKTLIHCTTGLGRSAVLVASFISIEWIKEFGFPINVDYVVAQVRMERFGAIPRVDQYKLVYAAVAAYHSRQLKTIFKLTLDKSELDGTPQVKKSEKSRPYTKDEAVAATPLPKIYLKSPTSKYAQKNSFGIKPTSQRSSPIIPQRKDTRRAPPNAITAQKTRNVIPGQKTTYI